MKNIFTLLQNATPDTNLAATVTIIRPDGGFASPTPELVNVHLIQDPRFAHTTSPDQPFMGFFVPWLGLNMTLTVGSVMAAKPSPFVGWTRAKCADGTELDLKFHILAPLGMELSLQEQSDPLNNALQLFMQSYVAEVSGESSSEPALKTVTEIVTAAHEDAALGIGVS